MEPGLRFGNLPAIFWLPGTPHPIHMRLPTGNNKRSSHMWIKTGPSKQFWIGERNDRMIDRGQVPGAVALVRYIYYY